MYSEADLQAAVSAGALSHAAAEAFRAHARECAPRPLRTKSISG